MPETALVVQSNLSHNVPALIEIAKNRRVIVTFGDSGSLQHNCAEQVEGDTLENPYESMEKQGFLS